MSWFVTISINCHVKHLLFYRSRIPSYIHLLNALALTIGSNIMTVNQAPVQMDVAPEIKDGRTMLPARWVAEALSAEVDWDENTKQAIIKMPVTEE